MMNFNSLRLSRHLAAAGLILFLAMTFFSCHNAGGTGATGQPVDTISFPNIGQFLAGQFKKIDSLGSNLTIWDTHKGKTDSALIGTTDARNLVSVFMGNDESAAQSPVGQYTRNVLPDSSHHSTIISYEAEGDSVPLSRVDVFVDSGSSNIRELYLQYMDRRADSTIRLQLIWKTDKEFTLIRTVDKNQYTADMRKQKVSWTLRP